MEVFSFLLSGLKTISEENNANDKVENQPSVFSDATSIASKNPLNQNVPQNMLKILESLQNSDEKTTDASQTEDILNLMRSLINPQTKQCSNIILSSSTPAELKNEEKTPPKGLEDIPQSSQNKDNKPEEISPNESFQKSQSPNTQNMNDFLFLSKVATMCNQLNDEEKNKKEKKEKVDEEDEEKEYEEMKFKSKKIKKLNWGCGHFEREHYAKNLCNNCYRKYGRNKKPWNCSHNKLYAHGLCQNCYINKYNQIKKFKNNIMINPQLLTKMNFDTMNLGDINFEHP